VRPYVLDSNLYIEASRNPEKAKELAAFSTTRLPRLFFHAVVAQEIIAGATTSAWRTEIERNIVGPFERRGRLVTPSFRAWKRSGEIISELIEKRRLPRGGVPRSFLNDVLLAASCREEGLTLVTKNTSHFELIADVEDVQYLPPWPKT
jgi:predicted nucleic acid-binding protein